MSEPFVFDSRHGYCKEPFGAIPQGGTVSLHCRPLTAEGFTHCALVLHREFADIREEREMPCAGFEGERTRFSITLAPSPTAELVWYCFRFWQEDGSGCYLDKTGYGSDVPSAPWQLTVYEPSPCPAWFGGGVTYQIFPDRFWRLSVPDPTGLVGERWVHQAWEEDPVWQPDADGEVRNRDFFGGSLAGIAAKLEDLSALGVSTLYLNPIFEAASNHRYDTANYAAIDPMLGTEADFTALCAQAKALGIRVILDGVFNHTGSRSLYFNADGFYPTVGAAQSQDSPYFPWFSFHPWPDDYAAWWGIRTLPAVEESAPGYADYIANSPDAIIRRWLRLGASGWRLDVADELPDWFIAQIRTALDETIPDGLLLGEVWEDGSTKIAYSQRRRYLLGREVHGLMNYPFRTALLAYLQGGDANDFREAMETLRENYPPGAYYSAMNFLGTHDTPRILTVLGADTVPETKGERAAYRLSPAQRARGCALVRLAALVLFTFPGSPTVYYGDEAGMEGFEDPMNRGTYPWGREDGALKAWFARLGTLRRGADALGHGSIRYLYTAGPLLAFVRELAGAAYHTVVSASPLPQTLTIPWDGTAAQDLLTGADFPAIGGTLTLELPPYGGYLLV